MKIALCQINPTVGGFQSNEKKILIFYQDAVKNGAHLVVFPELVITGYPPQDLLYEQGFIQENTAVLDRIIRQTTIPILLGYVREEKGRIYNSAALGQGGKQMYNYDKMLLPTYDVFDEDRYFTAGENIGLTPLEIDGCEFKVGIQICEDLWDHDYDVRVSQCQRDEGADLIINISASPYHARRLLDRAELVARKARSISRPFLYCNLVGAQDELIFDGQSVAFDEQGALLAQGQAFREDTIWVDLDAKPERRELASVSWESETYAALCLGVKDYFRKTGHNDAVIGLSGGIDSSLVACIATDALGPEHVYGIYMPSRFSSAESEADARRIAENLNIDFQIVGIQTIVESYDQTLKSSFKGTEPDVTEENLQARSRGNILMALSNKFKWLVLSTGNKTELALGYCTLYGDMSGGLSVISDLSKTDVYALSRWANTQSDRERIPENCILKPPSAELKPDQVDPFDYDVVSPLVDAMVEERKSPQDLINEGADRELVTDLYHRIRINEFKRRQAAPGLRVTPKAFGMGRRVPIVNHFNGRQENK